MDELFKPHCQCPSVGSQIMPSSWYREEEYKARDHAPGACPGDYELQPYKRGEQTLWLCSCCNLIGDIPVGEWRRN